MVFFPVNPESIREYFPENHTREIIYFQSPLIKKFWILYQHQ